MDIDARLCLYANKEVVLSAGAIGTPQILMLSGIGPANELSKHGIRQVVNAPDVVRVRRSTEECLFLLVGVFSPSVAAASRWT